MVRHIIMFKLREFDSPETKASALSEIKAKLNGLKSHIGCIRSLEVGINVPALPMAFDYVLTEDFDSWKDLEKYRIHPEHQAFIDFNRQYTVAKHSVDYEF